MNISMKAFSLIGLIFFILLIVLGQDLILSPIEVQSQAIAASGDINKELETLNKENRFLEAELKLTQKKIPYIILDPFTKKIYLKDSGVIMREFDIVRIAYWKEKGLSVEPVSLLSKQAPFYPQRKEIKPHKPEEASDAANETTFLEVEEMPFNYTLIFEREVSISIIAAPEKDLVYKFKALIHSMSRHIHHSFNIVRNHLQRKTFAIIDLVMSKEDAQALYWSLQEGANILILGGSSS